ncbi:N-acylphosphatidylethanolamine synthase-like isoform X4 [Miscanthus floridulus]|uniref:N-acylphosphatidylethanolamine synthase-like isoform X4 n=1 Tax=Miscanthus floridulus TaxID=154761 RepID=UPI00345A302F
MSVDLLRCLVCSICRNSGAFPDEFCVSIGSKYQLAVECLERMLIVVSVYGGSQQCWPWPLKHLLSPTCSSAEVVHANLRLDDPLMWGFKGFPTSDAKLGRWVLTAEDICFKNVVMSYMFRLGKCIPITRGGGIYQEHMNEALDVLKNGGWLHTFPEGKIAQDDHPIRRLKWGTASLIVRAPITPIVLPIVHSGFEKVMPEKSFFGRRPPVPLCSKKIDIIVGEPIEFDMPSLKQEASMVPHDSSSERKGWPTITPDGLDEAAQRWLYQKMSDKVQSVMERLRKTVVNMKQH